MCKNSTGAVYGEHINLLSKYKYTSLLLYQREYPHHMKAVKKLNNIILTDSFT